MKIERKCHNCGKELWLRDDYKTYVCRRCGTEYVFRKDNKGVESMDQTKEAVADVLSAALCVNNEMLETTNAQDVRNYIRKDFAKAVIIKGMEIPKNCFKCDFRDGLTCMAADQKEIYRFRAIRKRENFCPMIEVDADDIVSRKGLLEEYDRQHVGQPGGARKIIEKAQSAIAQSIYLEKTESRLDDLIKDPTKDLEFTKSYLQAYKNIIATGCCNECADRKTCSKRPEWGQLARYNCMFFERENNV